jgi:hypothetical protein
MVSAVEAAAFDWPAHQPVAYLPGSLPMGGVVPMTPIHAFVDEPPALRLHEPMPTRPVRRDIDLGGLLAFTVEDVITPEEADAMVQATERLGYRDAATGIVTPPGMRMNKSVHWLADAGFMEPLARRISALLPQEIDGNTLFGHLSQRVNMYRYDANDVFNRHTDGDWPGYSLSPQRDRMLEWPDGLRSCLTMLLYLNGPRDGVQGGDTRLFRPDGGYVDVSPVKGSALFFRHGFGPGSVLHEGRQVRGAVSKYVARINVMYGRG